MGFSLSISPKYGPFLAAKTGGGWGDPAVLVLLDDGRPVAGALFDGYTGCSINLHLWLSSPYYAPHIARLVLRYAFRQLRVARLTLMTSERRVPLSVHHRLGAVLEGRLQGAGSQGEDILISRLLPESHFCQRVLNGTL